jgi:SAM-dependent methyltransferase
MAYYHALKEHYERKLQEYGPNSKGMDWPNPEDLEKRFKILSGVIKFEGNVKTSLLDLGCGVGLFIPFLSENKILDKLNYKGVDISEKMIEAAKILHPTFDFELRDILQSPFESESFDYIIMNGLLTEKQSMSQLEMTKFAQDIIQTSFKICNQGLSFNVMSSHVDWKRDDLFHWELDNLVAFLVKSCTRNIKIHMDYGLYEYTVYLYK